jgi:hypothetical protein
MSGVEYPTPRSIREIVDSIWNQLRASCEKMDLLGSQLDDVTREYNTYVISRGVWTHGNRRTQKP